MSKDLWKWFTLLNPEYYFLGKMLGGEAEEGADEAMEEYLIPGCLILLGVVGVIGVLAVLYSIVSQILAQL